MPTIKFTVRSLSALRAPESGRLEYWDADYNARLQSID